MFSTESKFTSTEVDHVLVLPVIIFLFTYFKSISFSSSS